MYAPLPLPRLFIDGKIFDIPGLLILMSTPCLENSDIFFSLFSMPLPLWRFFSGPLLLSLPNLAPPRLAAACWACLIFSFLLLKLLLWTIILLTSSYILLTSSYLILIKVCNPTWFNNRSAVKEMFPGGALPPQTPPACPGGLPPPRPPATCGGYAPTPPISRPSASISRPSASGRRSWYTKQTLRTLKQGSCR